MIFVVHIYFYLVHYCSCTIIYAIYISHYYQSFQFLQPESIFSCYFFLFINILVVPLSKSTFTVMPLCIFTFSTPIFSHTSLNILNILLKSLCPLPSLAVHFGTSVYMSSFCAFPSMEHAASLQFYPSLFLPTLHSRYKILLLSYSDTFFTIVSFLPHSIYCTLVIYSLLASPSLQFHASWHEPYHMFFTCFSRRNSCPWFLWVCTLLLSYSPQSTYVTTVSSVIHPLLSRSAPSGGVAT